MIMTMIINNHNFFKSGKVVNSCNLNTWDAEAEGQSSELGWTTIVRCCQNQSYKQTHTNKKDCCGLVCVSGCAWVCACLKLDRTLAVAWEARTFLLPDCISDRFKEDSQKEKLQGIHPSVYHFRMGHSGAGGTDANPRFPQDLPIALDDSE